MNLKVPYESQQAKKALIMISVMTHKTTFMTIVRSFVSMVEEMGNPFLEDSKELLSLDTRNIMSASVIECQMSLGDTGENQWKKNMWKSSVLCTRPITDPLPRNKLFLFTTPVTRAN